MLKAAANLTRDLNAPKSIDLLGRHARLGVARLCGSIRRDADRTDAGSRLGAGLIAVLALYRAGSFIHELTHIKKGAVQGFRFTWNLIVGVPLMVPSFMYEGVHNQHHAKRYYGTIDDPEYLPLALMHPWTLPVFLDRRCLGADRNADPLRHFSRPCRCFRRSFEALVVGRYSGLQINPKFVRPKPDGEFARDWAWQEAACSIWAIALIAMVATGVVPLRDFLIFLGVASGVMLLNQIRTLVAHLWENEGEPMSVTAQFLDSVNVPPPATAARIVGAGRSSLSCAAPPVARCFPTTILAKRTAASAASSPRARPITPRPTGICRHWSFGWREAPSAATFPEHHAQLLSWAPAKLAQQS